MLYAASRKKSSFKDSVLKDVLFYYTFLVLLFKFVTFHGFVINHTHLRPRLFTAARMIFQESLYRPAFYFGSILVLLAFAFLFKNRGRIFYYLIINTIVSFILLVDLWYFRGFDTMPTLFVLQQGSNLDNLSDSVFSLIKLWDLVFVFDIFVVLAFVLIKRSLYRDVPRNIAAAGVAFVVSIALLVSIIPVRNVILGQKGTQDVFNIYDASETSYNISPIGYHAYNVYTTWKDSRPLHLTDAQKKEISNWFEAKKENLPDNDFKGMFKGKNVIVIQFESLEKFVINQKINGQEITPVINKMLKNSLYFSNFYTQINDGSSSDADLLANTSVYPLRQGSTFFRYPNNSYNSLPILLEGKGYSTAGIHSDKGSFWNWVPALTSFGFDKCIDFSDFILDECFGMGLSDGSYLRQVEGMIKQDMKQPFYSFIVTLTSHMPFTMPKEFSYLNLDEDFNKTYLGGYFQSINYSDRQVGMFLDLLKKDNLLDNTVVLLYGDHEGVHRFYNEEIKKIQPAESWWQENGKHIPFLIYNPSLEGREIATIGGQVDVLPTLSYLMGVDEKEYENTSMGRNLLKTKKNFAVLSDKTFVGEGSDSEKEHAIKGLDIADIIIKSNYFKK